MKSMNRLCIISLALFFAIVSITACKSKGGGESGAAPQSDLITRRALLNDKQVVSTAPVTSSATGTATVTLDPATNRLTGTVTVANLTDAAVYISDGDAGSNGGLVVGLEETPPGSGTWAIRASADALTAAQADRFRAAGFYVNVATFRASDGEIRGQLLSYVDNIQPIFDQHCAVCHNAGGTATATGLFLNQNESYARLVSQSATQSAGIRVIPFDADNSVLFKRIKGIGLNRMPLGGPFLSSHDENLIKAWINMGAVDDSGVFPQPAASQRAQFVRRAFLTDKQIVAAAPVLSSMQGTAALLLDTTTSRLTGTITLTSVTSAVASVHINDSDAGGNGAPVVSLVETASGSGTLTVPVTAPALTAAQMDRFKIAGFYVSVDTSANPAGEIRGQLLSYADNIQPMFNNNCVNCHTAPVPSALVQPAAAFTGMLLSPADSYAGLVNRPATQSTGARVVPFDADNSVLLQRITGAGFSSVVGSQMPPPESSLAALSARDQDLIKTWINMGAIDESGVVQSPSPIPSRQYTRNAFLNNIQVVPASPVVSAATATATVVLDTATSKLTGTVVISNMTHTGVAVHISDGDADNNGVLVVNLAETPVGSGIWTIPAAATALTATQMNRFLAAGLYVSADTFVNPNGEIRGQFQTFSNNVQPLLTARCAKCHNTGIVFTQGQAWATLVNQPATQSVGIRVKPFDAGNSVLYNRIMDIGFPPTGQMPLDGPPYLPLRGINIIKTWINMGAPND
jgi:mono/diheme cytochrome c family protein